MKTYNLHLKIKTPNSIDLGFTVILKALNLGEAIRKAEASYPGALFEDGWVLRPGHEETSVVAHRSYLSEEYGIDFGL